jgi:hypothetical protein
MQPQGTLAVPITVVEIAEKKDAGTPVPDLERPLAGVRVQLVNALGDVLTEGVTPADGTLTLTRDVPAEVAVFVRVPGVGLEVLVDRTAPALLLVLPNTQTGGDA